MNVCVILVIHMYINCCCWQLRVCLWTLVVVLHLPRLGLLDLCKLHDNVIQPCKEDWDWQSRWRWWKTKVPHTLLFQMLQMQKYIIDLSLIDHDSCRNVKTNTKQFGLINEQVQAAKMINLKPTLTIQHTFYSCPGARDSQTPTQQVDESRGRPCRIVLLISRWSVTWCKIDYHFHQHAQFVIRQPGGRTRGAQSRDVSQESNREHHSSRHTIIGYNLRELHVYILRMCKTKTASLTRMPAEKTEDS